MIVRREVILSVLQGDEALFDLMREEGLLPWDDEALVAEHAETARVVYTLVHELEVNWAGVEVILHMRDDLVTTRRQLAMLATRMREGR